MSELFDEDAQQEQEEQVSIDEMRAWFLSHFEDPVHSLPYISADGGYQWIYGGPFDAREELETKFAGLATEEDIDELVEELEANCFQWSPITDDSYFYDDVFDEGDVDSSSPRNKLLDHLAVINMLSLEAITADLLTKHNQLLYANIITSLEVYLCERFMQLVLADQEKLRKFVTTNPTYKEESLKFSDIYKVHDVIHDRVKRELADMVWHQLAKVKMMYKSALNVDMGDISKLAKAVHIRHDIVHRNGVDKDGVAVKVEHEAIQELTTEVTNLANRIENSLIIDF